MNLHLLHPVSSAAYFFYDLIALIYSLYAYIIPYTYSHSHNAETANAAVWFAILIPL